MGVALKNKCYFPRSLQTLRRGLSQLQVNVEAKKLRFLFLMTSRNSRKKAKHNQPKQH